MDNGNLNNGSFFYSNIDDIEKNETKISNNKIKKVLSYKFPSFDLLKRNIKTNNNVDEEKIKNDKCTIIEFFARYGINAMCTDVYDCTNIIAYKIVAENIKDYAKVIYLQEDISNIIGNNIYIEIKDDCILIEIPYVNNEEVTFGDIICNSDFRNKHNKYVVALGIDSMNNCIGMDLIKIDSIIIIDPENKHKNEIINNIIMSIIYKNFPEQVKLMVIGSKDNDLIIFNDIPHLLIPVVTDLDKANIALNWSVNEMTKRHKIFAEKQVKDLAGYNQFIDMQNKNTIHEDAREYKMPDIIIIISDLTELMRKYGKKLEENIVCLAKNSSKSGIHLILVTGDISSNILTSDIKNNIKNRITYKVMNRKQSRIAINAEGAEFLGANDILYLSDENKYPIRIKCCSCDNDEIKNVVKEQKKAIDNENKQNGVLVQDEKDEMFYEVGRLCIETKQPSIGLLQRKFRFGFNRAARVLDQLEQEGVISAQVGKKPRDVIMTLEEFENKYK